MINAIVSRNIWSLAGEKCPPTLELLRYVWKWKTGQECGRITAALLVYDLYVKKVALLN